MSETSTTGETIAYQPISGWAVAGLAVSGLFALMVLASAVVEFVPVPDHGLERHQESEGWIFELKVSQHVPMLSHIAVQILEHMSQADDATGRNGGARRERSEGDQPHHYSAGQRRRAALQKLMDHAIAFFAGVAEPADDYFEDFWIADGGIDADAPLFDLADDHVDGVVRDAEAGIGLADVETLRRTPASRLRHGRAAGKAKGQNVDVSDGAHAAAPGGRDNRILGGCEIAVQLKVGLHQRNGMIHGKSMQFQRSGSSIQRSTAPGLTGFTSAISKLAR